MEEKLRVKICGNAEQENFIKVCNLQPYYVGFIFYEKSKRFVANPFKVKQPKGIKAKRVGVFVNSNVQEISSKVKEFNLDIIQLHGDETPEFCTKISKIKPVFKAFQINNNFNFNILTSYYSSCYYFLFDTSSNQYGGSGKKFNWSLLSNYKLEKPFILSGGIGEEDAEIIKKMNHPKMIGIDVNSKFEISPGVKNISKLSKFLNKLNNDAPN